MIYRRVGLTNLFMIGIVLYCGIDDQESRCPFLTGLINHLLIMKVA